MITVTYKAWTTAERPLQIINEGIDARDRDMPGHGGSDVDAQEFLSHLVGDASLPHSLACSHGESKVIMM